MRPDHQTMQSVREMYRSHPFPQMTKEERHRILPIQLCKYQFLGLDEAMRGARVLDVGVGTGQKVLIPKHYDVAEYVGVDQSDASLDVARRVAEEEGFDRLRLLQGDLFHLPFPDDSFDVVISWGVLHVTDDPVRGLREMVRVCKPGGYVAIFMYNPWKEWRHNIKRRKIARLAGDDFEKRFEIAHRLYGGKPIEQMTPGEIVVFYDRNCVLFKSDHTYGEQLGWFDSLGLEYWGSCTPLRFRDCFGYLQALAPALSQPTWQNSSNPLIRTAVRGANLAATLPTIGRRTPPFKRPTILHRFFWQAVLFWQGRGGLNSHCASFAARKPLGQQEPTIRGR